ncbi:MFS transporter [Skermania piniformis]|nr:MFS transporter [Skermania piniformis]
MNPGSSDYSAENPWRALATLCLGFFMILLDLTIVAVANPAIMADLHTDISGVVWVTSAYLLTFAVPLLVAGRLGDKIGPKRIYLTGLTVFTLASLWCGLSGSIGMLIAARAVQGLGAAMMSPQTMAVITRIFPPAKRGQAMGAWGAVAGVATLVGPLAGGVLVDGFGWEWIFFINVPVGVLAFVLALRFVPELPTRDHRFDIPGVVISAVGLFLLVFGLQEGNRYDWSAGIWTMIVGGLVVLVGFVVYEARSSHEPLVPLVLFRVRNFSLANIAIMAMGAAVTGLMLPGFFYLEAVQEMSPTRAALVFAPMAVMSMVLAPVVGRLIDQMHPRYLPMIGFACFSGGLFWLSAIMAVDTPVWQLVLPIMLMGIGNACVWPSLGATATHDLPVTDAGAGSGIYNTTRQVGSVLGSAAIGALITARLAAHGLSGGASEGQAGPLPEFVRKPFAEALAESMLLPASVLLIGLVASVLFVRHRSSSRPVDRPSSQEVAAASPRLAG